MTEDGDEFGKTLASGNLDGDGRDELLLGIPLENVGSATDAGLMTILWGAAGGFQAGEWTSYTQLYFGGENESGDRFGWAMVAGDFDGNGRDDVASSAPYEDFPDGSQNAGAVHIREY